MSQYNITRVCGHQETIQIYGKVSERDRKATLEETRMCRECYLKDLQAKRAWESLKALEDANIAGLPALKGSEKQVAWAESIRAKILKDMAVLEQKNAEFMARIESEEGLPHGATTEKREDAKTELTKNAAAFVKIKATVSAKWFIDNRYEHIGSIVVSARG